MPLRMSGRQVALGCAVAAMLITPAWAQTQTPPGSPGQRPPTPRDAAAPAQKGSAVLRGRVVAADNGRPLRRARVTATREGTGDDRVRSTSTSIDGRFELKELPAGRYRINVTRGGYLALDYGQRRPGELGRPIELVEKQTVDKIEFALPRMGLITGRVTDENGEPIEGVTMYALRSMFFDGRRRLVPVNMRSETDDAGEFRITRLAPGTYYVMGRSRETWTVTANGQDTAYGYLPTYFPATGAPTDARAIRIGVGQEVNGVDFSLLPGRSAAVSGIAVDSKGQPFQRVSISEEVRGTNFGSFMGGPSAPVSADGTFRVADVAPGTYTISASRQTPDPEAAIQQIVVDGSDIEGLVLRGSSGGTVTGRVISESGTLPKTGVRIAIAEFQRGQQSPTVLGTFRSATSAGATPEEDGSFTATHVFGRTKFRVTLPDGWMLKQIVHDGQDVTENVTEMPSGGSLSGVEVHITDRLTTVSGQVLDRSDAPLGDATVIVFPSDRARWYETSRSVRSTRPDQQGKWQVKTLPPGEYFAVALDYVEDGAWDDPEFLDSLRESAQRFTLAEAGLHSMSLKLVTKP